MRLEARSREDRRHDGGYYERPRFEIIDAAKRSGMHGSVLDIGCAAGITGQVLIDRQIASRVVGIESNATVAALAKTRLSAVIVGDATNEGVIPAEPFDGLILADVLEHQTDPARLLKIATTHLVPAAKIIISVPNVRHFRILVALGLRNRWDYTDEGVCDRTHVHFFTSNTIVELVEQCGLRVEFACGLLTYRGALLARAFPPLTSLLATQILVGCVTEG